ncbi:MAG: hypothetical protein ACI92S_005026 [Planctomycetaceae bacterium]
MCRRGDLSNFIDALVTRKSPAPAHQQFDPLRWSHPTPSSGSLSRIVIAGTAQNLFQPTRLTRETLISDSQIAANVLDF